MILLKKLTLTNFLSHENTEIDFSGSEKALIDGASGAGKSSIFDAILWALYGEGRADNRSLIRKGSKRGSVCLELRRQNEQVGSEDVVIITRSATQGGKHTLEVAIQQPDGSRAAYPLSGVRELQSWIDTDLLGASYLLFINSVACVQGNTESFVSQTAPKRKELLLEIVKAEDYGKYYENARQRLAELDNDRSNISGEIAALEASLASLEARLKGEEGLQTEIAEGNLELSEITPQKKDLEDKKIQLDVLNQTISLQESNIKRWKTNLGKAVEKVAGKDRLIELLAGRSGYATDIEKTTRVLEELRSDLTKVSESEAKRNEFYGKKPIIHNREHELRAHASQIEKYLLEPVCPSGDACPYSGDNSKHVEDLRKTIRSIVADSEKEAIDLANWTIEEASLPPASDIRGLVTEIEKTETHLNGLRIEESRLNDCQKDLDIIAEVETEILHLKQELEERTSSLVEQKKQKDELDNKGIPVHIALKDLQEKENKLITAISRAEAQLDTLYKDKIEFDRMNIRVQHLKSEVVAINEKTRKIGLIKEAFSGKGIETLVCDYILPKLEDKINRVLGKLSDFSIRLDTQKPSADGEGVVEGLWITICNETGEELPYESYSGGEKVRITFAISEAFASLAQNRVGFRLVDEAVLALDENSLESFLEVVETLLADFSQVLFISHIQEVKDMFDKQIKINKNNGISYVQPT